MEKVLAIVPYYSIYPPMNGGMQRCFNILHQLAKHFELTAIIHQDKNEFLQSLNEFPAITSAKIFSTRDFNSKDVFSILPSKFEKALRYRWYKKQIFGSADGNVILYYPILKNLLKTQKFDVVILENLATLNAISLIRKYDKSVKIIYDAHNVDTNLAKAALEKSEIKLIRAEQIYKAEATLYQQVNAIFTCSPDDKKGFLGLNKGKLKIEVVPNGVNIPEKFYNAAVQKDKAEYILFCGSLWSLPNAEGLHWFCKKIWPLVLNEFPDLKLLVVGNGELPEKYSDGYDTPSIEFTGAVADVKSFYNKASISVVPLLTGSGTRLKILEAMGLGVPVISTTIGAEGITYSDGSDILIADNENHFAEKIIYLLKDKQKRLTISRNAKKLVEENYEWNVIGERLKNFINS
ncbi:MAG: glycosyltransferase family 4 protein [Bacteroidota bacterium]|nr:glycosyltransferase family 4 protein [Bacteroidota bacterium]